MHKVQIDTEKYCYWQCPNCGRIIGHEQVSTSAPYLHCHCQFDHGIINIMEPVDIKITPVRCEKK